MRIVMLGAPGSGKGTQGELLSKHFGIPKLSTGDALRAAVKSGTRLGRLAKAAMDAGQLVADELVIGIARERLAEADAAQGFILDGFPRNVAQAVILDELLIELGQPALDRVLHLQVSDEEITRRLLARGEALGRSDDTEATVKCRLGVYRAETCPLLDYYASRGLLVTVTGTGPLPVIFERIRAALAPASAAAPPPVSAEAEALLPA